MPLMYGDSAQVLTGFHVVTERLDLVRDKLDNMIKASGGLEAALGREKLDIREEIKNTQLVTEKNLREHANSIHQQVQATQVTKTRSINW